MRNFFCNAAIGTKQRLGNVAFAPLMGAKRTSISVVDLWVHARAAQLVPVKLLSQYLEQVARELQAQDRKLQRWSRDNNAGRNQSPSI